MPKYIILWIIFRNIYWKDDKTLNIVDYFLYFQWKVMSKFFYYSLLTMYDNS